MGYRGRIYFTEKQKAEIWDRWQRGESMSSIGRRGIVTLSEIGPVWTINQQAKSLKSLAPTLVVVPKFRSVGLNVTTPWRPFASS